MSSLDVVAGDPPAVAAAARRLASIADEVARHATKLRSLSSSCWTGTAATRAQARTATLPPKLDKVTASYGAAGSTLLRYASALADAQQRSATAIASFNRADAELQSARAAQAAAEAADSQAAAAASASGQPAPPPSAARYQASIDAAAAARARAIAANEQAHEDLRRSAAVAAGGLKAASHEGIRNQSWWQHFKHSVAHWTSTQWHEALAQLASVGGKISLIAGIAAAVLAVGGIFFPPLEAAAAAAEGLAFVSGSLSAASAAANELTTPGHRRDGVLTLGIAFVPGPATKLLRKLPILPHTGVLGVRGLPRSVPLGMPNADEFRALGVPLRKRLDELGYPGAVIRIRGSSVTGVRYDDGKPFDFDAPEKKSDYDLAISDPHLFEEAQRLGANLATGTRTWPLDETEPLIGLGLEEVRQQMSITAKRPVSFMIYKDEMAIIRRGLSIRFPR